MSKIVVPGSSAPSNLVLAEGVSAAMVEGDVYNICERIKEVDPSLFIIQLENDAKGCAYAIMERCEDGMDRLVYKTQELDQRIIEKCQYMKRVPFEHRAQMIMEQVDREEEERREKESEELYEKLGAPMRREFARTGFIDGTGQSFPKVKGKVL